MTQLADVASAFLNRRVVNLRGRSYELSTCRVRDENGALHVHFFLNDDEYDDDRADVGDDAIDTAILALNELCAEHPALAATKIVVDFEVT